MRCETCQRKFKEGEKVIPVAKYVTNPKRGDFVSGAIGYIHLHHIKDN